MANEITHNAAPGLNLYICRFQPNGNVFLTDGSSDEVWGTGGRDANDYDVAMTESTVGVSGHYKADFDASSNIAANAVGKPYKVVVYKQAGGSPVDPDPALSQGKIEWDGSTEITLSTIPTVTEIWSKAMSDLAAGAPSVTASVLIAINYLYEAWRNKTMTNSANNEVELYKDDDVTKLCESDISDDGTRFTKGKYGASD